LQAEPTARKKNSAIGCIDENSAGLS